MMRTRVARCLYGAFIVLLILITPLSVAGAHPGMDESPTPEAPNSGITGFLMPDRAPADAKTGDAAFTKQGVPLYDSYGMSGMTWSNYDLGHGPDVINCADCVVSTMFANWMLDFVKVAVAFTANIIHAAFHPDYLHPFDALLVNIVGTLKRVIFEPWIAVFLAILGVTLMWRARDMRMSAAAKAAGWAVLVLVGISVIFAWPVKAGSAADGVVGSVLTGVYQGAEGVGNRAGNTSDDASQYLYETIVWDRWVVGNFGSLDSPAAVKYAKPLFQAESLTWAEAKEVQNFQPAPHCFGFDCFSPVIIQKQGDFKDVATDIREADPTAYQYLMGKQSGNRFGAAGVAIVIALCALPMLFVSAVLIIASYLIVRLCVAISPAVATVGVVDTMSGTVKGVANVAAAAVINGLIFGICAIINLIGLGVLFDPASGVSTWMGMVLAALWSLAMWFGTKPYRRLTQLASMNRNVMRDTAGAIKGAHSAVGGMVLTGIGAAVGAYGGVKAAEHDEDADEDEATTRRVETKSIPADPAPTVQVETPAAPEAPVQEEPVYTPQPLPTEIPVDIVDRPAVEPGQPGTDVGYPDPDVFTPTYPDNDTAFTDPVEATETDDEGNPVYTLYTPGKVDA